MIWLFILLAISAFIFKMYAGGSHKSAPFVTWWSVIVAALTLAAISLRFAFVVPEFSTLIPLTGTGMYLPFILVLDFFLLLGPTGNAILWGLASVWVAKKAFDGGGHRYALKEKAKEAAFEAEEQLKLTKS